ncbi:sugar kinase [Fodinicola feengrottensis]|uniref:sugar kinase n=1 Tax=Fodinicola feengrottensis TaxID=435914 RepID=UPI0031D29042
MPDSLDLITVGEPMVLFQPPADQRLLTAPRLDVHVAGAELNVAAGTARFGVRTALCTAVGADPLGARLIAAAADLGIDTTLIATDPERPTGLFLKDVTDDGARRVYYYRAGSAAARLSAADADRVLAARPTAILTSGLTAALGEGPYALVARLCREAPAAGIEVAFDVNIRPQLGDVRGQGKRSRELLEGCGRLFIGTDEALPVFGVDAPDAIIAAARSAGVAETVVKAGADGLWVDAGADTYHLPSAASSVVDPVGAGDAVAAGYLVGRLRGLAELPSAWLGNQLAAGIVSTLGDVTGLPTHVEAAELLVRAAENKPA